MQSDGGAALLGSPVHGSGDFYESVVSNKVEKVLTMQSRLEDLDDPQVELLLLRSCLSQCKVNHLLRTLPPALAPDAFKKFDLGLRCSLEALTFFIG